MNYDVPGALAAFDFSNIRLWAGLSVAMLGFYGYYLINIRAGFRDRSYGIPIVPNMFNFAGDVTYLCLFERWFYDPQFDAPLPKLMWFGIAAFVAMECVVHYQTLRFGLAEIFPGLSRREALAAYAGTQIAMFLIWHLLWNMFGDPLSLMMFVFTTACMAWFPLIMLLRRGTARGQSQVAAVSLMLTQPGYLCVGFPMIAPDFDAPIVYLMGVAGFIAAGAYAWQLARVARGQPGADDRIETAPQGDPDRVRHHNTT